MIYFKISKTEWDECIESLIQSHDIYAAVSDEFGQDYEILAPGDAPKIVYNKPKPATPLKTFFLPVRENVTSPGEMKKQRVIIGIPACDIAGLTLLDEIYLEGDFTDNFYKSRRENTVLISSDCFETLQHCHCVAYEIKPYSDSVADIGIISLNGSVIFRVLSERGMDFLKTHTGATPADDPKIEEMIEEKHRMAESVLKASVAGLPDSVQTANLIIKSGDEIWKRYSSGCVSCGACTAICPTCSCFLLIDKPGFEKVKQMDACQYPGFERVAGGEDPLLEITHRFRNRYMCKYIWKSKKFRSVACTGCGRCIEACIGRISKNELFLELAKQ